MSNAVLNLNGVQFELARRGVDEKFRALADELEVAYYDHWRHGISFIFQGRDAIAEGLDPKGLFDQMHGAIWTAHAQAVLAKNATLAQPYPQDKIDPMRADGKRQSEVLAGKAAEYTAAGVVITVPADPIEVSEL